MSSNKDRYRSRQNKPRFLKILGLIFFWSILAIASVGTLVFGVGIGVVSAIVKDQPIMTRADFQKELDGLFQTSYAYFQNKDADGNKVLIGALRNSDDRNLITSIDDVNPYLRKAFISIEDRNFYEHNGISPLSIARATYQQISRSKVMTGGSTITQQLVKLIILKDLSKNLDRKAKEIVLALRMERLFTKDEIYLYYMNSVFFGKGAHGRKMHGISSAAKGIFNKDQKDLNIPQAAFIAGLVQRPNDLNPFSDDPNDLKRGLDRMRLVLKNMLETGAITKEQYEEALTFDIVGSFAKHEMFENSYERYPFIMFAIETEAAETLMRLDGLNIEELSKQGKYRTTLEEYKKKAVTGGYRFYTTIDEDLYNTVNQNALKNIKFHSRTYKGKKNQEQIGAVIMDNKTGAILAFVSGSEKFSVNQKDHALDVPRQPGSTIKPLLDYGPALEEGIISPSSKIVDEAIPKADGSGYYVNANGKYQGPVTVAEALKWSYNIPAIKTFNALGHGKGFSYLQKMNFKIDPKDGESASVGGFTHGFTVRQMTAAFSMLGNSGQYNDPFIISKVTDADGKVIWEHKLKPVQVFSPKTSYQLTHMLKGVLNGTGSYIGNRIPREYEVAGKTGTSSSDKDLWFIGYTPNISIGVWAGYDYNHQMGHNETIAKQAWVNIFTSAIKSRPDLFPKSAQFPHPGVENYTCGFDCNKVREYERKKQEEEMRKKLEQQLPNIPITPNDPTQNPDENPPDRPRFPEIPILPDPKDPGDGGNNDKPDDDKGNDDGNSEKPTTDRPRREEVGIL